MKRVYLIQEIICTISSDRAPLIFIKILICTRLFINVFIDSYNTYESFQSNLALISIFCHCFKHFLRSLNYRGIISATLCLCSIEYNNYHDYLKLRGFIWVKQLMRVPSFYFCLRMAFYMKVSIFRSKADSKRDSTGKRFFFFFFVCLFVCFFFK